MAADLRAARPEAPAGELVTPARRAARARSGADARSRVGRVSVCRCDFAILLSIFRAAPAAGFGVARPARRGGSRGDTVQTTLLGLAIAFIIALIAALVGPYFIDWNQFRPQFEAEATRIIGAPVRVGGKLDARLLPAPSLQLRSVVVGGANDLGKVRADKLDVEFSLGSLMRGECARHRTDDQRHVARSRPRSRRGGSTGRPRPGRSIWARWRSTGSISPAASPCTTRPAAARSN